MKKTDKRYYKMEGRKVRMGEQTKGKRVIPKSRDRSTAATGGLALEW
jgi:hypothetical protein